MLRERVGHVKSHCSLAHGARCTLDDVSYRVTHRTIPIGYGYAAHPLLRMGLGQAHPTGAPNLAQWRHDYALAQRIGIPVLALKSIASNESGGNPRVTRFEGRVFNNLTNHQYASQIADEGHGGTGTSMPASFTTAFHLNPAAAVKATSWGEYQVLAGNAGPTISASVDRDPQGFITRFNQNPQQVSDDIVAGWFGRPGAAAASARSAAQGLNWVTLAHLYNGCAPPCDLYAGRLQTAYARLQPEWQQIETTIMGEARRHRVALIAGGAVAVAGVAGAAWWLMRRRRRAAADRKSTRLNSSHRL